MRDGRPGPAIEARDFKRAFARFQKDQITDHAAALTYYSLLSLFPALLFGVARARRLRPAGADRPTPPTTCVDAGRAERHGRRRHQARSRPRRSSAARRSPRWSSAWSTSLYGASGAFGAVGRALNTIWRVEEGRGFVKHKAHDLGWTLVLLVLALITFVLDLPRRRARRTTCSARSGSATRPPTVWRIARWPAALLVAMLIYAIVYYAAPERRDPRASAGSRPGRCSACWRGSSRRPAFFFYVSNFCSYSATYGAFAAAVILLVWLWLTNVVLLFGAELNAVIDLRRSPDLAARPTTVRRCRPRSRPRRLSRHGGSRRGSLRPRAQRRAARAVAAQLAVRASA